MEAIGQAIIERKPSLEDLVDVFIQDLDVARSSRDTYSRSQRQFISWLYETGRSSRMDTLQREDILAFKDYLISKKMSSYTISLYLTSVRKLYQWLEGKKVYPDITRGVKGPKKARGFRKEVLSPEQLRQVLEAIGKSTLERLRDYALVNLLARTGLRTIEIARARVEDLRSEPGLRRGERVLWVQGKGREEADEFVLLTKEALDPLLDYLKARGRLSKEAPLFASVSDRNYGQPLTARSISRIVKRALRRVGLDSERLTAHSLRHTAITLAVLGGASLQQAQAMARHSDSKTTLVYYHNLDRVKAGAERYIKF